jgi:ubiquinone biosynthesis protein UbiJ
MHPLIRILGKSVVQAASAKIATEMAKPENQQRLAAAAERLAERARTIVPPDSAAVETNVSAGIRALGAAYQNARRKPPEP